MMQGYNRMIYYQKNHWYMVFITFFLQIKKLWPYIIFISVQFQGYIVEVFGVNLILILLFSIFKWINTVIIVTDDSLVYREGAIIKDEMIIPIKSISLVELEKSWFYRLFRLRKLKIDSLSPSRNTEILMILKVKELDELYSNLSIRIKDLINKDSLNIDKYLGYKISAFHLLLLSMLRNNIILGIGLIVSSINVMSNLYENLEKELKDFIINLIKERVVSTGTILAIILSLLFVFAVILLIILTFSILATLAKYYKFKIYRQNNYLKVEYGLLNRTSYSIPTENIHALKVEQNLINQIFKLYTIKCAVVGYGDSMREDELIFPLCGEKLLNHIIDDLVPEFKFNGKIFTPVGRAKLRFYTVPVGYSTLFAIIIYFIYRDLWIIFLIIPIVILNRFMACKNSQIGYNNSLYYVSFKGFNRKRIYIRKSSTEEIWTVATIIQIRRKLCDFKLKYYSQKKYDWIRVRNLNNNIYEELKNNFNS